MKKAVPMKCPVCSFRGSYYGRLVFPEETEPATCPNHPKDVVVELVPVRPVNTNTAIA